MVTSFSYIISSYILFLHIAVNCRYIRSQFSQTFVGLLTNSTFHGPLPWENQPEFRPRGGFLEEKLLYFLFGMVDLSVEVWHTNDIWYWVFVIWIVNYFLADLSSRKDFIRISPTASCPGSRCLQETLWWLHPWNQQSKAWSWCSDVLQIGQIHFDI